MKIKQIKIEKLFGLEKNDFDIECFPNEKISIIYAFNGAGKSTLLELINSISKNTKASLEKCPFKSLELYFDNDKIVKVEKANSTAIDYTYRINGNVADETMLDELKKEFKVTTIFANKDYNRGIASLEKGSMFPPDIAAPNPIVVIENKLTAQLKDPSQRQKVEELRDIINNNFSMTFKHLEIFDDKFMAVPDSKYPDDPALPIHELSSGEIKLILMFYELLFETEPHSVVLLDEPESSLHVDWQKELLKAIISCCENNDIQIIVATHSPDVVENYSTQLTPMLSTRYATK